MVRYLDSFVGAADQDQDNKSKGLTDKNIIRKTNNMDNTMEITQMTNIVHVIWIKHELTEIFIIWISVQEGTIDEAY